LHLLLLLTNFLNSNFSFFFDKTLLLRPICTKKTIQELKKIIPEAISSNPIKLKDGTYLEDALQLSKADAMWFALINAVKEQQKQIEFLKKEIEIIKINNVNK
jgi:hypothetical protein